MYAQKIGRVAKNATFLHIFAELATRLKNLYEMKYLPDNTQPVMQKAYHSLDNSSWSHSSLWDICHLKLFLT